MTLNLHLSNVFGIFLEDYALRLTSTESTDQEFVCVITEQQKDTLKRLLWCSDNRPAYVEIERIVLATGLDIPMWLIAERGLGIGE